MSKFQYVELCTTFTSYEDPETVETYIFVFFQYFSFDKALGGVYFTAQLS